ncbi:UNVERIFIED_CONTAM: hypothetical protein Sindi_2029800, partial [Sesamum indicum]
ELKIAQHFTAVANPQANGQTEVTNRTIFQHLKTRLENKGSWVDELPGVLWAYRTTLRMATSETPFCFVYGTEAIIPVEIGEESQRVAIYDPESNQDERGFDLTMIEEKRDAAYARILHHKGLMMKNHDRRIRPRQLQVEASKYVGKLDPPWDGPYKVIEIRKKGTELAATMEYLEFEKNLHIGVGGRILVPVKGHQLFEEGGRILVPVKGHQLFEEGGRILVPVKGHQLLEEGSRILVPVKGHQPFEEGSRTFVPVKGRQLFRG